MAASESSKPSMKLVKLAYQKSGTKTMGWDPGPCGGILGWDPGAGQQRVFLIS